MDALAFKDLLGDVAKAHGFLAAHGGWYQRTPAALFVLKLQKSNFGNYFELNLKLFLGLGLKGSPEELKKLVKHSTGDVFRRQPGEYHNVFDLDAEITAVDRRCLLDKLFTDLVDHMVAASASPAGILRLRDEGLVYLLPAAEERLRVAGGKG